MKNVVECYKEFFGYFNALETNGALSLFSGLRSVHAIQDNLLKGIDKKTVRRESIETIKRVFSNILFTA